MAHIAFGPWPPIKFQFWSSEEKKFLHPWAGGKDQEVNKI